MCAATTKSLLLRCDSRSLHAKSFAAYRHVTKGTNIEIDNHLFWKANFDWMGLKDPIANEWKWNGIFC